MGDELDTLIPEFREKVEALLVACRQQGITMRPYFGLRGPIEQAKLWRQSRCSDEIRAKIAEFRAAGAPFLADCIERAGPQNGKPVTNAAPGLSWHQWGEAVDCFWLVGGQAEWSSARKVNGVNGYACYAAAAPGLSLDAGGNWARFKDWPHVQHRAASSPAKLYSLEQIDAEMRKRFG